MIRIDITNNRRIPSSPEFSVKFILKGKFIKGSYIEEYFPDPPETIDRRFLWAAWFAFDEDNAEKYFSRVLQTKVKKREPPKTVQLNIDSLFLKELLEHDVPQSKLVPASIHNMYFIIH